MKKMHADMGSMKKSVDESAERVSAKVHFTEALKMYQEGKKEEASEEYRKAVEHDPKFVEAYVNWGAILHDLGKIKGDVKYFEDAIEKYGKATKIYPSNEMAIDNWGNALVRIGRLKKDPKYCEEAAKKYEEAITINPNNASPYSNWAFALIEIGKLRKDEEYFREALAKSEEAIRINEYFAAGWYNKACGHALLRQKEQALDSLAKAIELDMKYKKIVKTDEDFKDLWDDERFKELVG